MSVRVLHGDCLELLPTLSGLDAIVCDPPYHLTNNTGTRSPYPGQYTPIGKPQAPKGGFMGKQWDGGDIALRPETWRHVLRALKPGAHLVAFGGTRTFHRMACAIEDAGFEIRDTLCWIYGSGFAKSHNLKRQELCNCIDGGNAIPSVHETSEHDLRQLRGGDLSAPINDGTERREVLFQSVPQSRASQLRQARPESEPGRDEQPSMEGRELYRARQGVSDGTDAGTSESPSKRLCVGTHSDSREEARAAVEARRGSPSQKPHQDRQRPEQSGGLHQPSGTLDGRALPGRGQCPRCGKLKKEYEAFGTALKPAWEPIILARKPLAEGTVAANVLAHGTGAINVDACRVQFASEADIAGAITAQGTSDSIYGGGNGLRPAVMGTQVFNPNAAGRWPANVLHDGSDEVEAAFAAFGDRSSARASGNPNEPRRGSNHVATSYGQGDDTPTHDFRDTGTASRFFYSAKASKSDRAGSRHPTVKPLALMRWLVRLVTPPGGTVLDCFAGSGTTGEAALLEGFNAVLIEREDEYIADINRRIERATQERTTIITTAQLDMFA